MTQEQEAQAQRHGRVIVSDVCGCTACMNEPHEADVYFDGDLRLKGRVWTTWSEWREDINGKPYRDRILDAVEVEGLRIPARGIQTWGICGIYTWGHVILDLAPNDMHTVPYDVCPYM